MSIHDRCPLVASSFQCLVHRKCNLDIPTGIPSLQALLYSVVYLRGCAFRQSFIFLFTFYAEVVERLWILFMSQD